MVIGPDEFRHVVGHFASGVTVITTWDAEGRPTGLTANAFTSVSLDPPLVLVCVDHKAQSYPAIQASGRFAVNILATGQEALSKRFALSGGDKFDGIDWSKGPGGLPLLTGSLAFMECHTVHAYPGGDHTIFVGRVEAVQAQAAEPLLYYRGKYSRLSAP
jgi:flavin reductase (DIM6/NTAB) family NADH-FMN oxidoreductase RutF